MKDIRIFRHVAQNMRVNVCGGRRGFRNRTRRNLKYGFVELPLVHDAAAVGRHEIAHIASEWVNPSFRLGWHHVDEELIRWCGKNGDVVGPLFALKVVEGGVEGLGSCEIESCVFLRRIKFLDGELLKIRALSRFVPD